MAEDNTRQVIDTLNHLITTCKDGENGFRTAAGAVHNADVKKLFESYSAQRARFATELQAEVERLGGAPTEGGSLTAALHRGWINIKSLVTGGSEGAIFSECRAGEDIAVRAYGEALKAELPAEVRAVVERQRDQVREARDRVGALVAVAAKA